MNQPPQDPRPDLFGAISTVLKEQGAAADAAAAHDRSQQQTALDRDAALYGTPAWDTLPAARQAQVGRHVAAQAAAGTEAA
ncbi:hypothetical protein [Streptomyces globosus]|uniref:hypothetical protein n=1 Tax=Streptomyces globosus TaxID=68209 RepID=UPI0031E28944